MLLQPHAGNLKPVHARAVELPEADRRRRAQINILIARFGVNPALALSLAVHAWPSEAR